MKPNEMIETTTLQTNVNFCWPLIADHGLDFFGASMGTPLAQEWRRVYRRVLVAA
jgi:surfactin synthase thioesterase subunit